MRIVSFSQLDKRFFAYEPLEEIGAVRQILKEVMEKGDDAVRQYTEKFDNTRLGSLEISRRQIKDAYAKADKNAISSLRKSAANIRSFAEKQYSQLKNFEIRKNGFAVGQKVLPLERVGCYVPGGRYPLPSTALMTVIPAKVAGVKEVIVCSPKIQPITVVAADLAGADRIFSIGGIQAIGAMAYGTETVPKVDKIVGPGNRFVTAAKREVFGIVGIDFIAGPSEVLIIADETGNPEFIAADLLAQAEHDTNAKAYLVTTSKRLAEEVNRQLGIQICSLKTKDVASASLDNGLIILANNLDEAIGIANSKAPEHLGLQVKNEKQVISKLKNYGSLFIGEYSAQAFGDYASGTNHVLPTNTAARYSGGLSVRDFIKILTYQKIGRRGAEELSEAAMSLADVEGLDGHKKAAGMRAGKKEFC